MKRVLAAAVITVALPASAMAQTAAGSAGCTVITQAAADGIAGRIQADDSAIRQPMSVKNLTCLDKFFNGFGLNLITNILDPTTLLNNVEGKICSLVSSTLSSLTGAAQCGLTITGFNLGFGGFGGGGFCPKLSFGGGGPTWGTFGTGTTANGGGGGFTVNGAAIPPTGYPVLPSNGSY
jgi:hypothetical protein